MTEIILEIVNVACLCFTIVGAVIIGQKGDKLSGWYFYTVAATLGIIYFAFTGNWAQLALWAFFFVNDVFAIRRKKREIGGEEIFFRFANPKGLPVLKDLPTMANLAELSVDLSEEVVKFVNVWLKRVGMKVVQDDGEEEPVVVAAGNNKGHGHVNLKLWFKKTDERSH